MVCIPAPPVKRHRGEPGHTQDSRAHTGTRITKTNLTTKTRRFHRTSFKFAKCKRYREESSCYSDCVLTGAMPVTMRFAQPPPSPNKAGLPADAAPVLEVQRSGTSLLYSSLHSSLPRCDSPGKPGKCVTPRPRRGSARTLSPHESSRKIPRISRALPTGSTPRSVTPRSTMPPSNESIVLHVPRRSSPQAPDTTPRTARATSSRYSSVAASAASTPPSSSRQLFSREYDCRASNGGGETWQQWPPTPPQQWQPTLLQLAQTPPRTPPKTPPLLTPRDSARGASSSRDPASSSRDLASSSRDSLAAGLHVISTLELLSASAAAANEHSTRAEQLDELERLVAEALGTALAARPSAVPSAHGQYRYGAEPPSARLGACLLLLRAEASEKGRRVQLSPASETVGGGLPTTALPGAPDAIEPLAMRSEVEAFGFVESVGSAVVSSSARPGGTTAVLCCERRSTPAKPLGAPPL